MLKASAYLSRNSHEPTFSLAPFRALNSLCFVHSRDSFEVFHKYLNIHKSNSCAKILPGKFSRPLGTRTTLLNYFDSVLKARGSSQFPTIIINKLSDIYLNTALAWAPQQHTASRTKYAFNIFSYTQILATRFLSTQRRFFSFRLCRPRE